MKKKKKKKIYILENYLFIKVSFEKKRISDLGISCQKPLLEKPQVYSQNSKVLKNL